MILAIIVCFLTTSCAGFLGAQSHDSTIYNVQIIVIASDDPAVSIGSGRTDKWMIIPFGSRVTVQCEGYPDLQGSFDGKTIKLTNEGKLYTESNAFDGTFEDVFTAVGSVRGGFTGTAVSVTKAPDGSERYRCVSSIFIKK